MDHINLSTPFLALQKIRGTRLPAAYRGKVILRSYKGDHDGELHLYRELARFRASAGIRMPTASRILGDEVRNSTLGCASPSVLGNERLT